MSPFRPALYAMLFRHKRLHILKKVPGHLTHRCEVFIVGNRNRDDNGIRNAMFPVFIINNLIIPKNA